MRKITRSVRIFSFILLSFVSITASNAQDRFEIDEEGNIILLDSSEEKPEETKEAPQKPSPTKETPLPAPKAQPKSEPLKPLEPQPTPEPQTIQQLQKETKPEETPKAPTSVELKDVRFPTQAAVVTRIGQLRAAASDEARIVALLRRGDTMEALSQENGYLEVKYLLEGQFPISGWILIESVKVSLNGKDVVIAKSAEQNYEAPTERAGVQTEASQLAETEFKEDVELPEDPKLITRDGKPIASAGGTEARRPRPTVVPGAWQWRAKTSLGWTRYEESVATKIDGEDAGGNFLDYSLDGIRFSAELSAAKELEAFTAGARASYHFSLFDSSISTANINIESANVLGQFHQFGLEGLAYKSWNIWKLRIEPEVSLGPWFQLFSVNQLRERSLAQPVLFSDIAFYLKLALRPRVYIPYNFLLEPYLGIVFSYWFVEGPKQATSEGDIQTGTPSISPFLIHYGVSLAWELAAFELYNHWIRASYLVEDFSKSFSGEGNRAGIQTEDASSSTKVQSISLGYEYRF